MYIFICTCIPQGPPGPLPYMPSLASAIHYGNHLLRQAFPRQSFASSTAALLHCPFPRRCRNRNITGGMVHVWTAYVAVTGLPSVPVLLAKGVVATESMLVTRLPVVTAYALTAKAVGPALSMAQDDVALLAVAAEIAVVRGKMLAVATAVLHMAGVPTAVVTRTVAAPPAMRAALVGIATAPLAAALAGLAVEIAAAIVIASSPISRAAAGSVAV